MKNQRTTGEFSVLLLGGFTTIVLALVWVGFVQGIVLSTLWGWFIAPVFHLPSLTVVSAWGLALVCRVLHGIDTSRKNDDDLVGSLVKSFFAVPLGYALVLGIAWVVKSWM